MQNISITFTENAWWLPGGFIVLLLFSSIFAVAAWQARRHRAVLWLFLLLISFGVLVLAYYVNRAFMSFTRLERQGSVIRFYYYFGRPREFQWGDVQRIVREPASKGQTDIRFFMRDGTELKSYETHDEGVIAQALALRSQLQDMSPNPQGGANGRQPLSSEANRTPAAAASRRSP